MFVIKGKDEYLFDYSTEYSYEEIHRIFGRKKIYKIDNPSCCSWTDNIEAAKLFNEKKEAEKIKNKILKTNPDYLLEVLEK